MRTDIMRMPVPDDRDADTPADTSGCRIVASPVREMPIRHAYRPAGWRSRLFGAGGVAAIAMAVAGGMLFTWTNYPPARPAPALTVFDVAPPAAPPEPVRAVPPGPEKERKEWPPPQAERREVEPPVVRLPRAEPVAAVVERPVPDPGPSATEATAPEARPMPPAPQSSNAVPTWQGQVLAALNKVRRYPRAASFRRQQGIPYIRFIMDRGGRVLSSRLERSSGVRALDDEATGLPERAQPLPKPPEEVKGDTIELVVPVEFFMR